MANLSELLHVPTPPAASCWIDTLGQSTSDFVAGWPATPVREPDDAEDPVSTALAAAYRDGEAAGRAAADAERALANAQEKTLGIAVKALDEAASEALAEALAQCVAALCEETLAPVGLDHDALRKRCRRAAAQLAAAPGQCRLHHHPDDGPALASLSRAGWTLVADDSFSRGSIRLEGPDGALVDGPDEWRRAIVAALRA